MTRPRGMIQPLATTADDYFEGCVLGAASEFPTETGERRLVAALLEDQLRLALGRGSVFGGALRERAVRSATAWVLSAATSDPTGTGFTFVGICDALGLDPEPFQRAVREGRTMRVKRRQVRGAVAAVAA